MSQSKIDNRYCELPKLSKCQDIVYYNILLNEETTRQEIVERTGLTINNVCGRVFELIDKGMVEAYKVKGERRERLVIKK